MVECARDAWGSAGGTSWVGRRLGGQVGGRVGGRLRGQVGRRVARRVGRRVRGRQTQRAGRLQGPTHGGLPARVPVPTPYSAHPLPPLSCPCCCHCYCCQVMGDNVFVNDKPHRMAVAPGASLRYTYPLGPSPPGVGWCVPRVSCVPRVPCFVCRGRVSWFVSGWPLLHYRGW